MNKKGFTLVELLAVITLLAILMSIAVPNVISTINNNKKNTFLMDAERMISKANYFITSNRNDREKVLDGEDVIYTFSQLNEREEFKTDADGGVYDSSSYVKVSLDGTSYKYCICVIGSRRKISTSTSLTCNQTANDCLTSEELTGITVVKDK